MHWRSTLANALWWASNALGHARFRNNLNNPRAAQQAILLRYLRTNAQTAFGRAHQFASIRSIHDYQSRVPLSTFDDYEHYIERIRGGEPGILTRAPIARLMPSSGSSRARKLIPYTAALQREFNAAIAPWIWSLFRQDPRLMMGRAYWSISPIADEPDSSGSIPIGFEDDSAYIGGFAKSLVDSALAVPSEVKHIQSAHNFRYVTLLFLLRAADLRLISIWHPSFLTLLLSAAPAYWNSLIADIAAGTCSPPSPLQSSLHQSLLRRLRPAPRRSRHLARIQPTDYRAIWPRLRLISCWADGNAALYAAQLQNIFPHIALQPKGLLATEAFISFPYRDRKLLAITSHFFEFQASDGLIHLAHELDKGAEYSVIVTTAGGLYRYRLQDRIRITDHLGQTPALDFLAKEDHISDHRGEKLSEGFVAHVLSSTFEHLRIAPAFVLLAPEESDGLMAYTLFIESDDLLEQPLAAEVDALLGENPHYRHCRTIGQLGPVRCQRIQGKGFLAYSQRLSDLGQRLGNIKPAVLSGLRGWSHVFGGEVKSH